jgi:hypothetical protein
MEVRHMTKLKTLLTKAKKELKGEDEISAVNMLKESLKRIADCKKTLKRLEKAHNKLLNSDIDDLELDGWEY